MSDFSGLTMGKYLISHGPEDDARMAKIEEERHQAYRRNLERLFPGQEERAEFLSTPRPELGGLSIAGLREAMPYGIEVSEDIMAYLVGKRESGGGWNRWFENAVGGYFFVVEQDGWLDSPNELLGGRPNREIASSGGSMVMTKILWFLLLKNPAGKEAPMFREPEPISPLQEEMLLDEFFPESAGLAHRSRCAAEEARQRGRMFLFVLSLIVVAVAGCWLYNQFFG